MKNVTIVIDGQAGSCGKGKICGYLACHDSFSISINNWSSNAGHTFVGNKVTDTKNITIGVADLLNNFDKVNEKYSGNTVSEMEQFVFDK